MVKHKRYTLAAAVVVLLIIIRIALPFIVERYVNKTLNDLPGYNGHVEDIDLSLYRGAYKIEGLLLEEEESKSKTPFLQIHEIDLSVEWRSLLKGRLVGDVNLLRPELYIKTAPASQEALDQSEREHWTEVVKSLMPMTINRLEIREGRLAYLDYTTSPDVTLHIDRMHLLAHNLANVEEQGNALPSSVHITGTSIGGGKLTGDMRINVLKELPDFDLNLKLTGIDLTSINDFIEAYAKFDVERGRLDMYSELKLMNGHIEGYMKPFFEEVKVLNWKEDKKEDGFLRAAWEAIAGLFVEAVENQPRDQVATRIPISGNVNQPDTDISTTVVNVLRHAFIEAFNKGLEGAAASSGGSTKKD
ncbi:DUF748 domain-containing protein [Cesiribacter sp. SM1]|uniref:DUF748 domain-containing protein n=1 Tax=Cesiribacter sp. SM1 TaxID=2861196 RepID=UPI001CD68235|nr:DUF748 domain-containing protein [Cesiribacter sp. SM1]